MSGVYFAVRVDCLGPTNKWGIAKPLLSHQSLCLFPFTLTVLQAQPGQASVGHPSLLSLNTFLTNNSQIN